MTPQRRVDEWAYYVAMFEGHVSNCTSTPDGQRLRRIMEDAWAACRAELEFARVALEVKDE
jgi:hypothetical protein